VKNFEVVSTAFSLIYLLALGGCLACLLSYLSIAKTDVMLRALTAFSLSIAKPMKQWRGVGRLFTACILSLYCKALVGGCKQQRPGGC